ncbi:hypothetical protein CERSUDRAFT_101801 [Gelatoporia subvermispora B]|uniref:Zinc-finger domain-containing protein n=1 Tax=Ceriporiopsis subvermispora (strain B) TaxID=914234 RepID=M2QW03_CERS8|nr:hypothetical protein CERSUDRAFT_101801 [Gelatoporia subvermispora B]
MASYSSELANWDGGLKSAQQQPSSSFSSPSTYQAATKPPRAMPAPSPSSRRSTKANDPGPSSKAPQGLVKMTREPLFIPDDSDISLESSDEQHSQYDYFESRPPSSVADVEAQLRLSVDGVTGGARAFRNERNLPPVMDDSPLFTPPHARSAGLYDNVRLHSPSSPTILQAPYGSSEDHAAAQPPLSSEARVSLSGESAVNRGRTSTRERKSRRVVDDSPHLGPSLGNSSRLFENARLHPPPSPSLRHAPFRSSGMIGSSREPKIVRETLPIAEYLPRFSLPRASPVGSLDTLHMHAIPSPKLKPTLFESSAAQPRATTPARSDDTSARGRTFTTLYQITCSPLSECPSTTAPTSPMQKRALRNEVLYVDVPPFPAGLSRKDYLPASEILPEIQSGAQRKGFLRQRAVTRHDFSAFFDHDYDDMPWISPVTALSPSLSPGLSRKSKKRKLSDHPKSHPKKKQKFDLPSKPGRDAVIDTLSMPYEFDVDETVSPPLPPLSVLRAYLRHIPKDIEQSRSYYAYAPSRHRLRTFPSEVPEVHTQPANDKPRRPSDGFEVERYDIDDLTNADADGETDPDALPPTPGITPDSLEISASPPAPSRSPSPPHDLGAFRTAHSTHLQVQPEYEYAQRGYSPGAEPSFLAHSYAQQQEDRHMAAWPPFGPDPGPFFHDPDREPEGCLRYPDDELMPQWPYDGPVETEAAKAMPLETGIAPGEEEFDVHITDEAALPELPFGDGTIDPSLLGGPELEPSIQLDVNSSGSVRSTSPSSLQDVHLQDAMNNQHAPLNAPHVRSLAGPSRRQEQTLLEPDTSQPGLPGCPLDPEDDLHTHSHRESTDADDSDYAPGDGGMGKGKGKAKANARAKAKRPEYSEHLILSEKRARRPSARMRRATFEPHSSEVSDETYEDEHFDYDAIAGSSARKRAAKVKKKSQRVQELPYDMTFCHQCRRTTAHDKMRCTEIREDGSGCGMRFCVMCIIKRYPDIKFESYPRQFTCPRCRNTCNCTACCRKRGEQYVSSSRARVQLPDYLLSASTTTVTSISTPAPPSKSYTPSASLRAQSPVNTLSVDWTAGVSWGTIYSPSCAQAIGTGVVGTARTIVVHNAGAVLPKLHRARVHAAASVPPPPPPPPPRRKRQYVGEPQPSWGIAPRPRTPSPVRGGRAYIGKREALYGGYMPVDLLFTDSGSGSDLDDTLDSDAIAAAHRLDSDGIDPERIDPFSPSKKLNLTFAIAEALHAAQEAERERALQFTDTQEPLAGAEALGAPALGP